MKPITLIYLLLCLVAAVVPLRGKLNEPRPIADFPDWPAEIDGRPLMALPLETKDAEFAEGFPGRIGKFTDGDRIYILRWISTATRKLHSSADCLRGGGFTVSASHVWQKANGECWSRFTATRLGRRYQVSERIHAAATPTTATTAGWTDVSAWYWSALSQPGSGPWFAITVLEAE